jgi:hypothetical protein
MGDFSTELHEAVQWPFLPALTRLGLAVAIGVFVGLEREHSGKAGVRTFALTSLLGSAAGMLGGFYPAVSLSFTALVVANGISPHDKVKNAQSMLSEITSGVTKENFKNPWARLGCDLPKGSRTPVQTVTLTPLTRSCSIRTQEDL